MPDDPDLLPRHQRRLHLGQHPGRLRLLRLRLFRLSLRDVRAGCGYTNAVRGEIAVSHLHYVEYVGA